MIILDTDIVTLLSYGTNENLPRRIEAVEQSETLAVTVITRMEILQGRFATLRTAANEVELTRAMERFRASEALLASFVELDLNDAATGHFERLRKQKKLNNMRRGDMLIACIALAHKVLLVTRNTDDFKGVTGLRIENWAD
jgi:tRNA(fMet)-specific endonuclease VapC